MGAHVSYITPNASNAWIETAGALQVAKFSSVVSLSLAIYDYVACLDEEIELICKSPGFSVSTSEPELIRFPLVPSQGNRLDPCSNISHS